MAIDYETLLAYPIPTITQRWTRRDSILYALSVGMGEDPLDSNELRFVYEKELAALPTMASVLAYPGFWLGNPDTGIKGDRVLQGEQHLTLHAPLPVEGEFVGRSRVVEIVDKGAGRGAVLIQERIIADGAGRVLATARNHSFCRDEGGFGGPPATTAAAASLPERAPDYALARRTSRRAALLYRLNGDDNPIHLDPEIARRAELARPVLHGMCTFGIAGRALLALCCDWRPERLRAIGARFTAPVYPGETLRTEIWSVPEGARFRVVAVERQVTVINRGIAEIVS